MGKGITGEKRKNLTCELPRYLLFTITPGQRMHNGKERWVHFFAEIHFNTLSPSSSYSVHSRLTSGGGGLSGGAGVKALLKLYEFMVTACSAFF